MSDTSAINARAATGLTMMAAAMLAVPVMDAIAKYLSATLPPVQISFGRFLVPAFLLLPVILWRDGLRGLVPPEFWLHCLRGAGISLATVFFFSALKEMPMADTAAIFFIEPLILTIFSAIFLGERIGWRRILAVAVGFMGAMIVIRPSFSEVGPVALMPVGAAICFAGYMILTKKMAGRCDPWTMQYMAGVSGAVLMGLLMIAGLGFDGIVTPGSTELGWLVALGLMAIGGHTLIILALQRVEAASIAPFQYLEIIGATFWGYMIFSEFPDAVTWLGVAIIVGSGIFVYIRERKAGGAGVV